MPVTISMEAWLKKCDECAALKTRLKELSEEHEGLQKAICKLKVGDILEWQPFGTKYMVIKTYDNCKQQLSLINIEASAKNRGEYFSGKKLPLDITLVQLEEETGEQFTFYGGVKQ